MAELTPAQVELMRGKNFAAVATVGENGAPQTSIVWIDTDGEHVVFNTRAGRAKEKHLRRDPRVSITVFDAESPYRYFEVEGIAQLELEGAEEHIQRLSQKYADRPFYTPDERLIVKVKPERIFDYNVTTDAH